MIERAAHLVDAVLPRVPVRQWGLMELYRLRYRLAWKHGRDGATMFAEAARRARPIT